MLRRLSTLKTPVRQGAFGISALRSFTNSTRLGATAPELKSNVTDDGGNESKRAGGKSAPNCGPEPTGDHKFGRWTKRLAAITALCVGGAGLVAITEEIQKREKRLIERVEELQRKSERKTEQKYEDFLTGTRFAAWLQTRRNQNEIKSDWTGFEELIPGLTSEIKASESAKKNVSVFIGPPDCGDLETVRRYYRNLPGKIFDFTDVSDITEVDLLEKTIKLDGSFENIDTSNLKTKLTAFLNTLDMAERPIVIAYLPEKKDESSKARSSAEAINVWVQTGFRVVVVTHDAAVLSAINAQRNTRVSSQTVAYSDSADRASKIAKYLLSDKSGIAHRFKGQANRLKILSESIDAKDAIDLIRFSKSYTGKNDPVDLWLRNKLLESHFAWTKAIASFPTLGRSSAAELTEGMAFVSNKLEQLPSNRKLLPYLLKSGVLWKTDESYYSYYTPTLMELAWRMYGGKALHLHCGWCDSDIFEEIRSARTTPKA